MKTFYIPAIRRQEILEHLMFKNQAETIKFDCTAWADDNSDVTSVTLTVKAGQAGISSEALASNIKSCVITTSESGRSLIEVKITDGTNTHITHLNIMARDPALPIVDYGLCA